MQITFQGASWNMNPEAEDRLAQYTNILSDIPQLCTFLEGFLFNDFYKWCYSYGIMFMLIWTVGQLHPALAVSVFTFIIFLIPQFFTQVKSDPLVTKPSREFKMALIIYFTFQRIVAFMNKRKTFLVFILCALVFLGLPACLSGLIFPLLVTSIMVITENDVNEMHLMILPRR